MSDFISLLKNISYFKTTLSFKKFANQKYLWCWGKYMLIEKTYPVSINWKTLATWLVQHIVILYILTTWYVCIRLKNIFFLLLNTNSTRGEVIEIWFIWKFRHQHFSIGIDIYIGIDIQISIAFYTVEIIS